VTQPQSIMCMKEIFRDDFERLKKSPVKVRIASRSPEKEKREALEYPLNLSNSKVVSYLNELDSEEILQVFRKLKSGHQNLILSMYFSETLKKFPLDQEY
jgi:hypothetical protein